MTARSALADRIEQRLPLIAQPTIVVRGADDGFVGQSRAETAAALLPRSRLVVVPSEPHAVHYTQPDLIGGLVHDLLVEEPYPYAPAPEADESTAGRSRCPFEIHRRAPSRAVLLRPVGAARPGSDTGRQLPPGQPVE